LSAILGDAVTVVGADAGLHVVVWLNRVPRVREDALIARAQAAGLGVYPVSPLYAPTPAAARPDTAGLVMGYASLDEGTIDRGVRAPSTEEYGCRERFSMRTEDGAGCG
jgi:GntR family transcriptional regulator / MocR family aminotransferase